jgi:hypothetical protein
MMSSLISGMVEASRAATPAESVPDEFWVVMCPYLIARWPFSRAPALHDGVTRRQQRRARQRTWCANGENANLWSIARGFHHRAVAR